MNKITQILKYYHSLTQNLFLDEWFPPSSVIESKVGVRFKDWMSISRTKTYFERNWISEKDYYSVWEPIQNDIFFQLNPNTIDIKPESVFRPDFFVKGYLGGVPFYAKDDYLRLQRLLFSWGEQNIIFIEDRHYGAFPLRIRLDTTENWETLLSYGFIYLTIMKYYLGNFMIFGESKLWGMYVAADSTRPYNFLGIRKELIHSFNIYEQDLPKTHILYNGNCYLE